MKKIILALLLLFMVVAQTFGQDMKTYQYAERDTLNLYLDFYTPEHVHDSTICLVYVFGGGFIGGHRDGHFEKAYFKQLVDEGFQVAAIDYRLGLKGVKNLGITHSEPLEKAVNMAVEDAIEAVAYLLDHAKELKVNKDYIVMVGSSAGAITSLQMDYVLCNGYLNSNILPDDFRLAGVVSYSGAIYSTEGKVKYRNHKPAPTMLFHGTADRLVPYKKISLFKLGFFGTDALVDRFEKFDYPYFARRFKDYGHSIAAAGPFTVDDLVWFCRHYVYDKEQWQFDGLIENLNPAAMPAYDMFTPGDLYK
ncbi:MAG: alpha/beta hydrolase fold domain-containing protein [Bacteroidales bacterium]|nr:alpha/beta hydrolase fold domain-containing protein [Bacteroidales bacterium]